MKRKAVVLIAMLLIGIFTCAVAENIPDATSNFFVNDFAGIFSDDEIRIMMEKAIELDQKYDGIQVVVTTVKTINGEDLEVYANKMYNKYGIGKDDMGVLLLVVTEDRLIRAETGNMMQVYLPDSLVAKIMNESAIPYLSNNKFPEGMMNFQDAIIDEIKNRVKLIEEPTPVVVLNEEPANVTPVNTVNTDNNITIAGKNSVVEPTMPEDPKREGPNIFLMIVLGIIAVSGTAIAMYCISRKEAKKLKAMADEYMVQAKSDADEAIARIHDLEMQAQQSNKWMEFYKDGKEKIDKKFETLASEFASLKNKYAQQENELEGCRKKLEQVYALHPDIDEEIVNWLAEQQKKADMQAASEYDAYINENNNMVAAIENEDIFMHMINAYVRLTDAQKQYVTSDIEIITSKYEESKRLRLEREAQIRLEREMAQAERLKADIENELQADIDDTDDYYNMLVDYKQRYNGMSDTVRAIFTVSMMNALNNRISDVRNAVEERRRREEEERRRREEEERRRREEEERRRREEEERRRREEEERRRREEEERRRREAEERRRRQAAARRRSQQSSSRSSYGGFSGRGGRSSGGGASGRF